MFELLARLAAVPSGQIQAVRVVDTILIQYQIADYVGTDRERRMAFLPLSRTETARECIAELIERLNELVMAAWPYWFGNLDFGWYRNDALGNEQLRHKTRELAAIDDRVSPAWVIQAARMAVGGDPPSVASIEPAVQLAQSCVTLSRAGVVFVIPFDPSWDRNNTTVVVAVVEWLARNGPAAVVPLIPMEWADDAPLDRLLFDAWRLAEIDEQPGLGAERPNVIAESVADGHVSMPRISGISGLPHPLSDVEKRVWEFLTRDPELATLFRCNQTVITVHGNRPCVDLLWTQGRVVVELDGYPDHSLREAFERDRHRDYELSLSGYQVLRITNDEVVRDLEAAVGKIRDIVRLRKPGGPTENRQ